MLEKILAGIGILGFLASAEAGEVNVSKVYGYLTINEHTERYVGEFFADGVKRSRLEEYLNEEKKNLFGDHILFYVGSSGSKIEPPTAEEKKDYDGFIEKLHKFKGTERERMAYVFNKVVKLTPGYNEERAKKDNGHDRWIHPAKLLFGSEVGVCRDKALALAYIYQELGIKARYVTGKDHAWVRVFSDNNHLGSFDVDPTTDKEFVMYRGNSQLERF